MKGNMFRTLLAHVRGAGGGQWGVYWFIVALCLAAAALRYSGAADLSTSYLFSFALLGLIKPFPVLLVFLFFLAAGHREFTYEAIAVGPAHFYITEWMLFIVLVAALPHWRRIWRDYHIPVLALAGYVSIGTVLLILSLRNVPLGAVVRDFAVVYYALFIFAALAFVRGKRDICYFFLALLLGTLFNLFQDVLNYFYGTLPLTPEQKNLSLRTSYYYLVTLGWLLPYELRRGGGKSPIMTMYLFTVCLVVLLYAYSKTAMIALLILTVAALLAYAKAFRAQIAGGIAICFIMAMILTSPAKVFNLFSIFKPSTYDYNSRALLRLGAIRDFSEHPYGIGFGAPIFGVHSRELLPNVERYHAIHNSYLSILRRMGFEGFAAFCLLVGFAYRDAWRAWRRMEDGSAKAGVMGGALAFAAALIFAFAHVVLEGPFFGAPFWLLMGMLFVLSRIEEGKDFTAS